MVVGEIRPIVYQQFIVYVRLDWSRLYPVKDKERLMQWRTINIQGISLDIILCCAC